MNNNPKYVLPLILVIACGIFSPLSAIAQSFPDKPVRFLVGFPPGGPADVVARLIADKIRTRWGQPLVVENRAGANGVIAAGTAARAASDGYTLYLANDSTLTMNPFVLPELPYDSVKDFAPVTLATKGSFVLVANATSPYKTLEELISKAKSQPKPIQYGASILQCNLAGELFNRMAGTRLEYIPFKGSAGSIPALLAGEVPVLFEPIGTTLTHIKSGKLRPLATLGLTRSPLLPDIPTMHELGLKGYEITSWLGVVAPSGIPRDLVARLNADFTAVLRLPEMKDRLAAFGMQTAPGTPEQFESVIKNDYNRFGAFFRETGIKLKLQ